MSKISEIMTDEDVILDLEIKNQALANEVKSLTNDNLELKAIRAVAVDLIGEVCSSHKDKFSGDYNDCENGLCQWCEEAQVVLDITPKQSLEDHDCAIIEKCADDLHCEQLVSLNKGADKCFVSTDSIKQYAQQLKANK